MASQLARSSYSAALEKHSEQDVLHRQLLTGPKVRDAVRCSDCNKSRGVCTSLRCNTSLEVAYYAGKVCHFPDVCVYCGSEDHTSADDDIQSLKHKFSIVRPICAACKADGKEPAVRGEQNVGCKKKRK